MFPISLINPYIDVCHFVIWAHIKEPVNSWMNYVILIIKCSIADH